MGTVALGKENFEQVVSSNSIVLVDFWAAWCAPCRAFAPVFERASEQHPDIVFGKVDTEAEPELAGSFGIMSIPTLMAFRDQVLLYAQPGALPAPVLEDLIAKVKERDMDDVRRKIAEHEAATAHRCGRSSARLGRRGGGPSAPWTKGGPMELPEEVVAEVRRRLRRAAGQVVGVEKMLAEGRECCDVLTQLSAATKALEQAGFQLVAAGAVYCLQHPGEAQAQGYGLDAVQKMFMRLA